MGTGSAAVRMQRRQCGREDTPFFGQRDKCLQRYGVTRGALETRAAAKREAYGFALEMLKMYKDGTETLDGVLTQLEQWEETHRQIFMEL